MSKHSKDNENSYKQKDTNECLNVSKINTSQQEQLLSTSPPSLEENESCSVGRTMSNIKPVEEKQPPSKKDDMINCFGFEDSEDEIDEYTDTDVKNIHHPTIQNLSQISPVGRPRASVIKDNDDYLNSTRASVISPAYHMPQALPLEESRIISGNVLVSKFTRTKHIESKVGHFLEL